MLLTTEKIGLGQKTIPHEVKPHRFQVESKNGHYISVKKKTPWFKCSGSPKTCSMGDLAKGVSWEGSSQDGRSLTRRVLRNGVGHLTDVRTDFCLSFGRSDSDPIWPKAVVA